MASPTFASTPGANTKQIEEARSRLIVALDVATAEGALSLAGRLEGTCRWFKVGLELFTAAGPSVVEQLAKHGHSIFLDLKFHDIPNTVAGAVRSAAGLGARMMTLHGLGGPAMLAAARAEAAKLANPPELLAFKVMTSMDAEHLNAIGVGASTAAEAEHLARIGVSAVMRGFVCSPQEVAALRSITGPQGVLVVPGIRPAGAAIGDQKRVATPAETLRQGASYLVVGRPITQGEDPVGAANQILAEMATVL